jgi:hypothetical protein
MTEVRSRSIIPCSDTPYTLPFPTMRFMNLISLAATFLSISLVAATPAPPSTAQPPTVLSIVTSLQANLDSINAAVCESSSLLSDL